MREYKGDLWSLIGKVDILCVTTNGETKRDGSAVMGRGCAKEANDRWAVSHILGRYLRAKGNFPHPLGIVQPDGTYRYPLPGANGLADSDEIWGLKQEVRGTLLLSFPTKEKWKENSSLELIEHSLILLRAIHSNVAPATVALPRPGCSNGGLSWQEEVKPLLEQYLDDWFWVVSKPDED